MSDENNNYYYQTPPQQQPQWQPQGPLNCGSFSERNIVVSIILSIITCGIYGYYWIYCMEEDLNKASEEPAPVGGGTVVLLSIVTCGIYMYYWMYKAGRHICSARAKRGLSADSNAGILYIVLTFFGLGIVSYALIQNELNSLAAIDRL